jgi:hypothetical protein
MKSEREIVLSEAKCLADGFAALNATFLGSDLTNRAVTPLEYKFTMVYDYAVNGEWDNMGDMFLAGDVIAECITAVEFARIASANGLIHFKLDQFPNCQKAAFRANARIKLDDEHSLLEHELTISELADASGLTESYLRNAAAEKDSGRLPTHKSGGRVYISSQQALNWLHARGRSIKSTMSDSVFECAPSDATTYQEFDQLLRKMTADKGVSLGVYDRLGLTQEPPVSLQLNLEEWTEVAKELAVESHWLAGMILGFEKDSIQPRELERRRSIIFELTTRYRERIYGHMVLVPVAADGTFFHPGLKRRRGYQIGSKENEYYVSTYEDALERLKTMAPKPYWRRPNLKGIPGIVAGVAWKEIPQQELDRLATQARVE